MTINNVPVFAEMMAEWVLERWDAEVKNRPSQNVHRAVLHATWGQVYRKLTGREIPRPRDAALKGGQDE